MTHLSALSSNTDWEMAQTWRQLLEYRGNCPDKIEVRGHLTCKKLGPVSVFIFCSNLTLKIFRL